MIKKIITIKNILIGVLIVWIGFSIFYVSRDQWQKFQMKQNQTAYQSGVADMLRSLMNQAEKCMLVSLLDGDKKIEIVSTACLQNTPGQESIQPETQPIQPGQSKQSE